MPIKQGTPGVYLEELSPAPLDEFYTGVPAFLGFAHASAPDPVPAYEARLLTFWPDFEKHFGRPDSNISDAVRGFFANGGRRCYVVRLEGEITAKTLQRGLDALISIEGVDLVCAPDIMPRRPDLDPSFDHQEICTLQGIIRSHCDQMGNRLAILDAVPCADIECVRQQRSKLLSKNVALYHPWIKVPAGQPGAAPRWIPPCGHVAGVYAATDDDVGVFKAPAKAILKDVLDVSASVDSKDQEILNVDGINAIRSFPGRGIRVWGARTLDPDPAGTWTFVPVRRVFLTTVRWIERNMVPFVFEPNRPELWARIERELLVYFDDLFQHGALQGSTAQEAFYVKCDGDTNPADLKEGLVIAEVGLAPERPSEFIVVRIMLGGEGITIAAAPRQL